MKILFLNACQARNKDQLTQFVEQIHSEPDVFCLQEADSATQMVFEKFLGRYKKVSDHKFIAVHDDFEQVTYLKQNLNLVSCGTLFMDDREAGLGLFVQLQVGSKNLYICSMHGSARPYNKLDSPNREKISESLIKFFNNKDGSVIIGGDFNLYPDTKSIRMFEEAGFRNLINDYKIETTRNHFAWDLYPDNKQPFADYIFVDKNIRIETFSVINSEASDHLPMVLDIEI